MEQSRNYAVAVGGYGHVRTYRRRGYAMGRKREVPMSRRYASSFALLMGAGMLGMWAMFILRGQVPEWGTEPVALAFHLAAEIVTATCLVAAGAGLWRDAAWARPLYLFALGMFAYTAVVSPGYFAQLGQWGLVVMFAAFIVAAVPAALAVVRE